MALTLQLGINLYTFIVRFDVLTAMNVRLSLLLLLLLLLLTSICICTRMILSRHITAYSLEMHLSYFSYLLMMTLIFCGIIINLLLVYKLPYFLFCLLVFCVFLYTRVNFVTC
jgi:hypothetical protein